jgi:hypothetical protein
MAYLETFQQTKIWNAQAEGWLDTLWVTQDNMMAIAVLFNSENGGTGNSDPYEGTRPFTIHLVDASAAATHGNPGSNLAINGTTHTAFIDEGTTTW